MGGKNGITKIDFTSDKYIDKINQYIYNLSHDHIYTTGQYGYSIGYIYNMISFHQGKVNLLKPCQSVCRMQEIADNWLIKHRQDDVKSVYRKNLLDQRIKLYFISKSTKYNIFQAWKLNTKRGIKKEMFQTWKEMAMLKCNMCPPPHSNINSL